MKTGCMCWRRCDGSALMTVMAIVFGLCLVLGSVLYVSQQRSHMAGKLGDRSRAMVIAEAGIAHACAVLASDFELRTNPDAFPATAYAGGTYDVTITTSTVTHAALLSQGTYGSVTEAVALDVEKVTTVVTNPTPRAQPTNSGVLVGGMMTLAGNLSVTGAWIHCNNAFTMNGSQEIDGAISSCVSIDCVGGSLIEGDAAAPVFLRASPTNVTGVATVTNLAPVTIPNIDLTPLYIRAKANNQVFTNANKSLSGTVTPPGGVMWVDGNISLGNGTYTGCFVATTNIEMATTGNGAIIQNRVGTYPSFVSYRGDIIIKQTKTLAIDGLVYCKTGNFDKQGNGDMTLKGQVIVAGNFSKNGGWTGIFQDYVSPLWTGDTNTAENVRVIPTAWQK